jgi:hypothetical protein
MLFETRQCVLALEVGLVRVQILVSEYPLEKFGFIQPVVGLVLGRKYVQQ